MNRIHIQALAVLIATLTAVLPAPGAEKESVIGILGAFGTEVELLRGNLTDVKEEKQSGITFYRGRLKGAPVVLAETGVGKVNASMTCTLLLNRYTPEVVIFSGVAGALNPDLAPGDIVLGERIAQHDLGNEEEWGFEAEGVGNPVDGSRNPVFFASDEKLLALAEKLAEKIDFLPVDTGDAVLKPKVVRGTVVTGDVFVAQEAKKQALRKDFDADAVEMEGGAVAQVCHQQDQPFLIIRSLCDNADRNASVDFMKFYKVAAKNSSLLVMALAEHLSRKNEAETTADKK